MSGRNRSDKFIEHVEGQYGADPSLGATLADPDFHGARHFIPGLEAPVIMPDAAYRFLAAGAVRLRELGDEEGAHEAWPFEISAESYLRTQAES
jgi:hypothetical protein